MRVDDGRIARNHRFMNSFNFLKSGAKHLENVTRDGQYFFFFVGVTGSEDRST